MPNIRNAVTASLLFFSCTAIAEPIYKCQVNGNFVFQQVPCNSDKMDSLADTLDSQKFRRQEDLKAEAAEKRRIQEEKIAEEMKQFAATRALSEATTESDRIAKENQGREYLKLCVNDLDRDCDVGSAAYAMQGMSMGVLEELLGRGREQKIGTNKFYYYDLKIWDGSHRLQVIYEVNRTKTGDHGQVGNVVSEVNY